MRERFWKAVTEMKYAEIYAEMYNQRITWRDRIINIGCALVSTGSVSAWVLWDKVPWLWTIIIVVIQIIQLARPYLPYASRRAALQFYIPELRKLCLKGNRYWDEFNGQKDDVIREKIHEIEKEKNNLDCQYFATDKLPEREHLVKAAYADLDAFLNKFTKD